MLQYLPFCLAIMLLIVLLSITANKLRVAYPILLVITGLGLSFIPNLPVVRIDPDWIFFIFLPPLLFEAAWSVSLKEMKKWWRIIGSFAFLVVFFTALVVAVFANHFIPGFSIALGFVLGGIVSPPDAVSTGAITKFVKIPKTTSAILEGESLLNDASSLIIFRFALVAVGTGQFIWYNAATEFLWMIVGGVGIGLLMSLIFIFLHKRVVAGDTSSVIILSLIEPYIIYYIAEELHCSGVLAVVTCGLFMSYKRMDYLSSTSRLKARSFWDAFTFLLNGVVFFIIGLELPQIVSGIQARGIPISSAIWYGVLVTVILIIARIISSYIAMVATFIFRPSVAANINLRRSKFLTPLVLGWTGMRGVVSLAAALSIPIYLKSGEPFPHRDLILFITFVVILLTLVVQGLTLPYIITKFKPFNISKEEDNDATIVKIQHELKRLAYDKLKMEKENILPSYPSIGKIIDHWENQLNSNVKVNEELKKVLLDIYDQQREYLDKLNRTTDIDEGVIRQQIHQIDLEEERLRFKY